MTRTGTERLLTAVTTSSLGIIVALLAGEPTAAILVTPWVVLLVLGLTRTTEGKFEAAVDVGADRLLVGDELEVSTTITGGCGSVFVNCVPSRPFWPDEVDANTLRGAGIHTALVSARDTVRISLRAEQWGVHDVGRVEVTATEPYGLFRWKGEVGETRPVRVHPSQSEVRNLLSPWLVRRVTGAHASTAVGRGVEYADIRPFASGDSLREINWKATARSTDLWVSQRHPDRATDVVLLLDSFVESGHDVRTMFGLAIEGAVALAESHLGVADRVGLVELGGTVRWVSPGAGSHQLQRLSDALVSTGLRGHFAQRDLTALMTHALPPRSFVVALTPLLDQRFIDALFILAGRGHDIGVIECESAWSTVESSAAETFPVARLLWQSERQMLRDRLAEFGIAVARWRQGDHLDLTLLELTSRRRRAVRGRRR